MSFHQVLTAAFGADRILHQALLAPLTTFKVGGPADWLLETMTAEETVRALKLAHAASIPVTILGGGSNVLIGDRGIRGLVIRPRSTEVEAAGPTRVRAAAGVTINGLVRWTINRGLAGLEAWAGTPGTVGGGVFGNAHYEGRLLGETIHSVHLARSSGEELDVPMDEMEFGYDRSRLQRTREVVLWVLFRVSSADPSLLRARARQSLAHRKQTQPLESPSAGCIFQNPDRVGERLAGTNTLSAGALIDRAGLKGRAIGAARVSSRHANFIINEGGATAAEIRRLIDLCKATVRDRFQIELKEEIVYLGEF